MDTNEILILLFGMILAAFISAVPAYFTGRWQNKTMKDEYIERRKLELDKINHENKLKKIQAILSILDARFYLIYRQKELQNLFNTYATEITNDKLSTDSISEIALLLVQNKLEEGFLLKVCEKFVKSDKTMKLEILSKLYLTMNNEINDDYKNEIDPLDDSGWAVLINNKETIKKARELYAKFNEYDEKSLSEKELKQFQTTTKKELEDIIESLRKEIVVIF